MTRHALLALLLLVGAALAEDPKSPEAPAEAILREALERLDDRAFLSAQLTRIEAVIQEGPAASINHYARGRILGGLGRSSDALAEYDRAVELDPKAASAHYSAGVLLAGLGREEEALTRWEKAVEAEPGHVDALYNAGQLHYNRQAFAKALACWSKVHELEPEDFDALKKVLQAQNALGEAEGAAKSREALFELHRTSEDPRVRGLKEYVFHQFQVGKAHVFAFETFDPLGGEGNVDYAFRWRVQDPRTQEIVGAVNLESSIFLRENGTPWVVGVHVGRTHKTVGPFLQTMPTWQELMPQVEQLIRQEFPGAVEGK